MFDTIDDTLAKAGPQPLVQAPAALAQVLLRLIDELDYGVILLTPEGGIQHANHLARHELATGTVIRNVHGQLVATPAGQTTRIRTLTRRAAGGHRSMVELGDASYSVSLAFVPLGSPFESDHPTILVLFGKRQVCETVTMSFFARSCGLSPAEEQVLKALCDGKAVDQIAQLHGVAESTVRTQVRVLRHKTRTNSIRELIRKIAALPPLVPSLPNH